MIAGKTLTLIQTVTHKKISSSGQTQAEPI
jgi:hypothetical protein